MKKLAALLMALLLIALPLAVTADSFNHHYPVAYMDIRFTCGCQRGGTGTMVGRYGLLTAAHNLYCHVHGKPLKTCDFYFGATSRNSCYYRYQGKFTYTAYDTFQNGYRAENDIGYVIFESPVGNTTGWYACMVGSDHDLHEEFFNVSAYDGNRKLDSFYDIQYVYNDKLLYWSGWLSGGEGGPVFFSQNEDFDYPTVTAVYISHDSDSYGYGRRLTLDVFNAMKAAGAFR